MAIDQRDGEGYRVSRGMMAWRWMPFSIEILGAIALVNLVLECEPYC